MHSTTGSLINRVHEYINTGKAGVIHVNKTQLYSFFPAVVSAAVACLQPFKMVCCESQ